MTVMYEKQIEKALRAAWARGDKDAVVRIQEWLEDVRARRIARREGRK